MTYETEQPESVRCRSAAMFGPKETVRPLGPPSVLLGIASVKLSASRYRPKSLRCLTSPPFESASEI